MPAISSGSRTRPNRCMSAAGSHARNRGRPGCTWCSPSRRGCSCRAELLLEVEGHVLALLVLVADDVVRARDDAPGAPRAQPGRDDLVVELLPLRRPASGLGGVSVTVINQNLVSRRPATRSMRDFRSTRVAGPDASPPASDAWLSGRASPPSARLRRRGAGSDLAGERNPSQATHAGRPRVAIARDPGLPLPRRDEERAPGARGSSGRSRQGLEGDEPCGCARAGRSIAGTVGSAPFRPRWDPMNGVLTAAARSVAQGGGDDLRGPRPGPGRGGRGRGTTRRRSCRRPRCPRAARRTSRRRHHLEPADRRAVAGAVVSVAGDRLAGQLGGGDVLGRERPSAAFSSRSPGRRRGRTPGRRAAPSARRSAPTASARSRPGSPTPAGPAGSRPCRWSTPCRRGGGTRRRPTPRRRTRPTRRAARARTT